jgi:uncharacterized membrane protein YeiH
LGAAATVATLLLVFDVNKLRLWPRMMFFADSLLLGFFAVGGSTRARDAELGFLAEVLVGVIAATGGGIIRDVVTGYTPGVFQRGTLYASVAFAAAVTFSVLVAIGVDATVATISAIALGLIMRLVSVRYSIELTNEPQPLHPVKVAHKVSRRFKHRRREPGA